MTKERIIKAGKEYIIQAVDSLEVSTELETSFILQGTSVMISCFAD
jgi:hypothetical protein